MQHFSNTPHAASSANIDTNREQISAKSNQTVQFSFKITSQN